MRGYLAGAFGALLVAALLFAPLPALGQSGGSWHGGGGAPISAASILTKLLTVDTDDSGLNADTIDGLEGTSIITTSTTANTTALTMNVAGNDVQSASGTALRLYAAGAANLELGSGNNRIDYADSGGTIRVLSFLDSSERLMLSSANNSNGRLGVMTDGTFVGASGDKGATTAVLTIADGVGSDFSLTALARMYGEKTFAFVPGDALTITDPTDTSSTPLGAATAGAGTACRMSAAGAAAWTPGETGAVDGMFWCCTNTGANAITMTDTDGQYEGPGSVVGQWDTVCMEYVTDRFVERSFTNNEP